MSRHVEPFTLTKKECEIARKIASQDSPSTGGRRKNKKRKPRLVGERDPKVRCAGCDKEIGELRAGWSPHGLMKELDLAPRCPVRAFVCAKGGAYSLRARKPCEQKARERLQLCPGCGSLEVGSRVDPGRICRECAALLVEGEKHVELKAQRDVVWYVIDTRSLFGYLSGWSEDPVRELGFALAQACCSPGSEHGKKRGLIADYGEGSGFKSIPAGVGRHSGRLDHEPCVELSPAQAEGLIDFCKRLQEVFDKTREVSKREGRSVLLSLARGELTLEQLHERSVAKQREPEEWEEPE